MTAQPTPTFGIPAIREGHPAKFEGLQLGDLFVSNSDGSRSTESSTAACIAVSNVYRATHDLFLAQRFARHVSPLTTVAYTHPGDEEMRNRVRGLTC